MRYSKINAPMRFSNRPFGVKHFQTSTAAVSMYRARPLWCQAPLKRMLKGRLALLRLS